MVEQGSDSNDFFEIYKFFEGKSIESILIFYLVSKNKNAILFLDKLRKYHVETTGDDLISMGFLPGAQYGEIFDSILKERFAGNIHNKREETDFIKTLKNS